MSKTNLDKYVVFKLGNETYSLNIEYVVRILTDEKIRPVPNTSEEIKGIIHTEEDIVPVVDLRVKFDIDSQKKSEIPFIIICNVQEDYVIGFVVDEVLEVIEITEADNGETKIKPINLFHANVSQKSTEYIQGIYRPSRDENKLEEGEEDDLLIILNVNKLLGLESLEEIDKIQNNK